jgi:glutathione peroxidase
MFLNLLLLIPLFVGVSAAADTISRDYDSVEGHDSRMSVCNHTDLSIYDFNHSLIDGTPRNFSYYKGEVLLVANVASFWKYTRQYLDFNPLLDRYGDKGLKIIAIPCNQFHLEEPGENFEILNAIKYVRPGNGYVPHKHIHFYEKVDVNGDNEHPLYTWLKSICPPTQVFLGKKSMLYWETLKNTDLVWNFEKFLIDRNGKPRFRFHPGHWNFGSLVEPHLTQALSEPSELKSSLPASGAARVL